MTKSDFKSTFKAVVERAKAASGLGSYEALGERIGVRGQTIANACGQNNRDMLSKPLIDEIADLAGLTADEKSNLTEEWLDWKLERTNDGGLAEFLLGIVRKKTKKAEMKKIIDQAADLRHKADRTGRS